MQNFLRNLHGVAMSANQSVPFSTQSLQPGSIQWIQYQQFFSLKSTSTAFTLSVGESAEGVDDVDLLMNFILTQIQWFLDSNTQVGVLTVPQWRTVLNFLNLHDFAGTVVNGATVPATGSSAAAFNITIKFPLSLEHLFRDGAIFKQGSLRMNDGTFNLNCGTLTGNVTLANGTAVVSAVSNNFLAQSGEGTEADIGSVWQVVRSGNLQTNKTFDTRMRIGLLDTYPVATNPTSAYNITPGTQTAPPSSLGSKYQTENITTGGYNIGARCTPLVFPNQMATIDSFAVVAGQALTVEWVSGNSAPIVYDITVEGPHPAIADAVTTAAVGPQGSAIVQTIAPPSVPPGSQIPAIVKKYAPLRIVAQVKGANQPGTRIDSAQGAANAVAKTRATSKGLANLASIFGRKF